MYYINNLDFAYNNINDINLFIFLNKFFRNKFVKFSKLFISDFKILKFFSGTFVYAIFKSYNYGKRGLTKYYKSSVLNKFFGKKLFKKKSRFYIKKFNKKKTFKFRRVYNIRKKKPNLFFNSFAKKKSYTAGFYDYRVETFKKISKKKGKFISRKYNFYKIRYLRKKCFLNYSFYVSNFKKNFGYIHSREKNYCVISKIMRKLKRVFRFNFSKKKNTDNFIFNNYFFKNPKDYYMKKSFFLGSKGNVVVKYLTQNRDKFVDYDYKNFFIFNIMKLFPKIFLNFSNKYTASGGNYVFIKNKLNFKLSFYNNFLNMYRKLPFFLFIKNLLSFFVNKFFDRISFTFIFCSQKFISANLVKNFILAKMSYQFKVNKIAFSVLRLLNFFFRKNIIKGFRVLLAGRFSRKDRATFY